MTQLELYKRFNRAQAMIVMNIENYVKEHGGYVECDKTVHMRYIDSKDDQTDTVYQFDHIYINEDHECIAVYTENTELSEIEIKYMSCDELHDLIGDIVVDTKSSYNEENWSRYIDYLHKWADAHKTLFNINMSPVSFDEWCDNEREFEDEQKEI